MHRTSDWERVVLDASPFFHFCKTGQIVALARYLGRRACVTREVEGELIRNAATTPSLRAIGMIRDWPEVVELPPELLLDLVDLLRVNQRPAAPPDENAGEISTVLIAQRLGGAGVVLEDELGKRLARRRGVPRISTAQLAAEMVAVGALDHASGLIVFDSATPTGVGEHEFLAALERAREGNNPVL